MVRNSIQFAVVREDPLLECEVLRKFPARRALVVASGGCTAMTLSSAFPALSITAIDPNPAQLDHVQRRIAACRRGASFDEHNALAESGNFESLFRGLRSLVHDLVAPRAAWVEFFEGAGPSPIDACDSGFWNAAFEAAFSEPLLVAMFGRAAVQHAAPGSYPAYFREAFERGLSRSDARTNPFLHHVFLGHYLEQHAPEFLRSNHADSIALEHGRLEDRDLSTFDFIGLSNVMDWMSAEEVEQLMARVVAQTRPGTVVMWRQLNNERPLFERLLPEFHVFTELGESLRARDRSMFYRRIHVCRRK